LNIGIKVILKLNSFYIQAIKIIIKGVIAYRDVFPKTLELMKQGYFSKDLLVTKRIKLEDIVNEGFEALVKEKSQVKILVSPK